MAKKAKTKEKSKIKTEKVKLVPMEDTLFGKALSILNEEFGEDIMKDLPTLLNEPDYGLSTGSLSLDYIINPSAGGMVKGQLIEFWGPWSSGKTTLALGLCANATANGLHVIYCDLERSLRAKSIVNAGIDARYFRRTRMKDGRKLCSVLTTLMKSGEVGVVVIDSLPKFKPIVEPKKGEDDADPTKPKMAFGASFQTEALDYLSSVASDHNVILILINQIRSNLSSYGGGEKPYGGAAKDHEVSVRIKVRGRATSKDDRILDSQDKLVGQYSTIVADKNKTSIPMNEDRVPIFLGRGVNPYLELANLAVQWGLISNNAGNYKWTASEEKICKGKENFVDLLFNDVEFYLDLRQKVIAKMGIVYSPHIKVINSFHDENGAQRDVIEVPDDEEVVEENPEEANE